MFHARNFEEFLHRDLKIFTVQRAVGFAFASTIMILGLTSYVTKLIPVGRRGITKISQTPIYQVVGPLGVGAVLGVYGLAAMCYWKTIKYTLGKIRFIGL